MADAKSEKEPLIITNNGEITPVDYVQVRRQRRQVCVGVAIACCLGVGLSLAVAIPLVSQQSPSTSGTATDGSQVPNGRLMRSAGKGIQSPSRRSDTEDHQLPANSTTTDETATTDAQTTTHHRQHPTWPTWPTDWTRRTLIPRQTTTQATTTPTEPTTPSWLPADCPRVPHSTRSPVDIKDLVDNVWYEMKRIQTFNAPGYVEHVSCSTLTINTTIPDPALDAELVLSWEEGKLFSRYRKQVTLHLHRNDSGSNDWIETTSENNNTAQFSFLARLDSFLLTYECFPTVRWFPAPGYVIRVFSKDPLHALQYGDAFADILVNLPEKWGLNTALVSPITIRQRFCDMNVGHE